jgi:hypothetical protein
MWYVGNIVEFFSQTLVRRFSDNPSRATIAGSSELLRLTRLYNYLLYSSFGKQDAVSQSCGSECMCYQCVI